MVVNCRRCNRHGARCGGAGGAFLLAAAAHAEYQWVIRNQVPAARWWFVGAELVFYFACMFGCVLAWRRFDRRPWVRQLLALAAGTNLLYHFPALFTVIAIVFEQREIAYGTLDHHTYLQVLLTGNALARVVHVLLASFAVTGLALSWIGALRTQSELPEANGVAQLGGKIALWCIAAAASRRCLGVVRVAQSAVATNHEFRNRNLVWHCRRDRLVADASTGDGRTGRCFAPPVECGDADDGAGRRADDRHFAMQPMNSHPKTLAAFSFFGLHCSRGNPKTVASPGKSGG